MLKRITMNAGAAAGQPSLEFDLSPVTVFVGPNNSGKSKALQEIERRVTRFETFKGLLVKTIEFDPWSHEEFDALVSSLESEPTASESIQQDHIFIQKLTPQNNKRTRMQLHRPTLVAEATNPNTNRSRYSQFLSLFTLKLDGANRLALTNPQRASDLQQTPESHFAHLFADNAARAKLRRIVHEAFGKYLVVDPTNIGEFRLRLSAREPADEQEERNWDSRAVAFHSDATLVSEASDGVKAFVGMLSTIIAGDPKITLIDEPEAFLHPALSARLGKEVTSAMLGSSHRLFIATHSAHFLMGCVQAGAAVNIVRLTYDGAAATARLLTRERLAPLMRNPLLRSVGVLNALFYNAVIVTESDADRAFYQEINERLLAANDPRGIEGCLFLNAQNKQTVWDIVKPLRELGIPAAGIVDIDVLKEGGTVWSKPLEGAFVPTLSHSSLQTERVAIFDAFTKTGKNMKRDGGIAVLAPPDAEACRNLFLRLEGYGVFVVDRGELEAWLSMITVPRSKGSWLVSIFEKMGDDPTAPDYVRPEPDDVWAFIGTIKKWVANGDRLGIPDAL